VNVVPLISIRVEEVRDETNSPHGDRETDYPYSFRVQDVEPRLCALEGYLPSDLVCQRFGVALDQKVVRRLLMVREAQTSESSQHLEVDVVSDDGVCDLS